MTKKEKLIFEMQGLVDSLNEYLHALEKNEDDEKAYERIGEGMFSVLWELRYYKGEESTESVYTGLHDPNIQGMKFE